MGGGNSFIGEIVQSELFMWAAGEQRGLHPRRTARPQDWRPSLQLRHSVFLSVSVALALACRREGAQGAAQAPWRYARGVSGHHRLLMTDVSPSELTVLQGCVQVQVEVGGSWRDGGDDGALAFLPLSPRRGSAWCLLLWVLVQVNFCSRQLCGGGAAGVGDIQDQWRWS